MISIIIPVYNVEENIGSCLESVRHQTYADIQIIIVNDGSTDNTLDICREIEAEDSRVSVITQENRGVSVARNNGIRHAEGEYIMFVDGDDIISPWCVEHLLSYFNGDTVAVIGDSARIRTYEYSFEKGEHSERSITCADSLKLLVEGRFPISACAALFRRDCVAQIRFPEKIRHNEDKYFLFQFLMANQNKNLIRTSEKVYGYYVRESSVTKAKWNGSTDVVKVADQILSETEKSKPELAEIAKLAAQGARLQVLKDIVLAENNQRNKVLYKKYRREVLTAGFPKASGTRTKTMYAALFLGRRTYTGLVKLYYKLYSEDRRFKVNEAQTSL